MKIKVLAVIIMASILMPIFGHTADMTFRADKALHLGISTGIYLATYTVMTKSWHLSKTEARFGAAFITLLAGVMKEGSDKNWDSADISYDCIGLGLGLGISFTF